MKYLNFNKKISSALVIIGFAIAVFFSFWHLTESPPTWMDEGIITQVARNMSLHGIHGVQEAPGKIVSGGFVSTGYPVTFPVSISLSMFGQGLFQARFVMVLFLLALVVLSFIFARTTTTKAKGLATLFLVVSFAPLYGHGKNVLGEIPGLMYLFAASLLLVYIQRHKPTHFLSYLCAGILLSLAIVSKPIFILLAPAFVVAAFLFRKHIPYGAKNILIFVVGLILPFIIWIFVQFNGDSLSSMLAIYSNPHNVDVVSSIGHNIKRFFTEAQPFYALVLYVLWGLSLLRRYFKKVPLSFVETFLFFFSSLIFLAYLRTIGYYRYFFLAQFISLIYLPQSLDLLWPSRISKKCLVVVLIVLVGFQLYQTRFKSYIADSWNGTRSQALANFAASIPPGKSVFVYQAPELVPFLKNDNYYQYMDVTTSIHIGLNSLPLLSNGGADMIFVNKDLYLGFPNLFAHYDRYGEPRNVDRYTVLNLIK